MLQALSEDIAECHRRAAEAERKALQAPDAVTRQDYLIIARRWRFLAHSYEFSERLARLTDHHASKVQGRKK